MKVSFKEFLIGCYDAALNMGEEQIAEDFKSVREESVKSPMLNPVEPWELELFIRCKKCQKLLYVEVPQSSRLNYCFSCNSIKRKKYYKTHDGIGRRNGNQGRRK